jgi:nitrite reductase/ring-hydroxylating ferredoxin subunit
MPEFKKVSTVQEIAPGHGKVVDVDGNSVAIWNISGNFFAFQNVCPHRGGPVGEGEIEGNVITCPWHGWSFDVTTGASAVNPAARLTRYDVKVEGSDILVGI